VGQYGWLSEHELLDAVAIGQITPGPMLSTASFVGYLVTERAGGNGLFGAAVATLAFLLPSFVLVSLVNPLIPRLRKSRWASRFLDAVTAASIGLMVSVTVTLTSAMLEDSPAMPQRIASVLIALVAAVLSLRFKVASAWLVIAGALAGRLIF
jgi:chromate transporter